eukprot:TRINITY_DN24911_c0_g1_i4.p1 TRINITY_DN24911_c0_g1~~TRINITY_DN24911_c0_g1_i4.p1  ORF type:complete len:1139 (+),score=180.91 TRINITY_DN24911_c0_g1_i4:96-3512(+)
MSSRKAPTPSFRLSKEGAGASAPSFRLSREGTGSSRSSIQLQARSKELPEDSSKRGSLGRRAQSPALSSGDASSPLQGRVSRGNAPPPPAGVGTGSLQASSRSSSTGGRSSGALSLNGRDAARAPRLATAARAGSTTSARRRICRSEQGSVSWAVPAEEEDEAASGDVAGPMLSVEHDSEHREQADDVSSPLSQDQVGSANGQQSEVRSARSQSNDSSTSRSASVDIVHSSSANSVPSSPSPSRQLARRASSSGAFSNHSHGGSTTGTGGEGRGSSSVQVVVRIRPRLHNEKHAKGAAGEETQAMTVTPDGSTVCVRDGHGRYRNFTVDMVIDSRLTDGSGSQKAFFDKVGIQLVQRAIAGYNVCVFAYGHTGSGKTHTMLGVGKAMASSFRSDGAGLLPRFIKGLDETLKEQFVEPHYQCQFFEVYQEKIRDLLADEVQAPKRSVHVHPTHGAVIDDLHPSEATSIDEVFDLIHFGNQMRTVAATTMNQQSSRSHAIFRFKYEMPEPEAGTGSTGSCADVRGSQSTVTFVDLAGREEQSVSTNRAVIFKEMVSINTSLFYLSHVIMKLSEGQIQRGTLMDFRNSKLTLLLSQALMGNSATTVITTVHPFNSRLDESISTLSFGQTVKKLKTLPVANKGKRDIISELEAEIKKLKQELLAFKGDKAKAWESSHQMVAAESLITSMRRSRADSAIESRRRADSRMEAMRRYSICPEPVAAVPFLTNLSGDASLQGVYNFFLREGVYRVGCDSRTCSFVLRGLGIKPQMAEIVVGAGDIISIELLVDDDGLRDETARVLVNGVVLESNTPCQLKHKDCIIFGYSRSFRLVVPTDADDESEDTSGMELDLDHAVMEATDTQSEQFKAALPFIRHLVSRASQAAVQTFVRSLHRICPMLDEANLITKEIRLHPSIRFELHALVDLFDFEHDKPELVVCVLWVPTGLDRLKSGVRTILQQAKSQQGALAETKPLIGHARTPLAHKLDLDEHMTVGQKNAALLYVWSIEKFLSRLDCMRELYEEGNIAGDSFEAVRQRLNEEAHLDPWNEVAIGQMQLLAREQTMTLPGHPGAGGRRNSFSNVVEAAMRLARQSGPTSPTHADAFSQSSVTFDERDGRANMLGGLQASSFLHRVAGPRRAWYTA